MIRVSVVIPVYNTERHLKQCLDSVLAQSLREVEIIIVNDCSPDNSHLVIENYAAIDSRIVYLKHDENKGLAVTRNTGMAVARGTYIIHLDSDDYWISTDMLSELLHTAETESCDILRFNGLNLEDGDLKKPIYAQLDLINADFLQHPELWVYNSVFMYLFRRNFLLENNLTFQPNINLGEDAIFLSLTLPLSHRTSTLSKTYYAYRINESSMMRKKWTVEDYLEENSSVKLISKNLSYNDDVWCKYWEFRLNHYWSSVLMGKAANKSLNLNQQLVVLKDASSTLTKKEIEMLLNNSRLNRVARTVLQHFKHESINELQKKLSLINRSPFRQMLLNLRRIYNFTLRYCLKCKRLFQRIQRNELSVKQASRREFTNIENVIDYNFTLRCEHRPKGVSAMLRVKNEDDVILTCLESIVSLFDEVLIVDNASSDETVKLIRSFIKSNPLGHRVSFHTYPFLVAKCGADHQSTPENSVHNLAYYYNWCLSKCKFSHVCKWDADMQISGNMKKKEIFKRYLQKYIQGNGNKVGTFPIQTIYVNENRQLVLAKDEVNAEVRLFKNTPAIHYVKGKYWEVLDYGLVKTIDLEKVVIYETKDVMKNEFSHWSSDSLLTSRKVKEYRNYMLIKTNKHILSSDSFEIINEL